MKTEAQKVSLTKEFNASKEELYRAWTEEEALKQWWKPMNKQLVSVENDLREGGKVEYKFDNDLTIYGTYKEVKAGDKLVYTWIWDLPDGTDHKGEYLLTIEFTGDGDTSSLSVLQEDFKNEHAVKPHEDGWEGSLNDLKQYLEK